MQVKLEKFEGPLGLLLKIIEKEELDITEISLAKIADEYLSYIRGVAEISAEEMADFLVVAAKLLLIKSRALLPYMYPEAEQEVDDLQAQLKIYKEFVDAAKTVEGLISLKKFTFVREFDRKAIARDLKAFYPPASVNQEALRDSFANFLEKIRPQEKLVEEVWERKVSIEERIAHIQSVIANGGRVLFSRIMLDSADRTEIVVSFLAMLELAKQRCVAIEQGDLFEEITIIARQGDDGIDIIYES
jgi:segregation and condensation protein A